MDLKARVINRNSFILQGEPKSKSCKTETPPYAQCISKVKIVKLKLPLHLKVNPRRGGEKYKLKLTHIPQGEPEGESYKAETLTPSVNLKGREINRNSSIPQGKPKGEVNPGVRAVT